MFNEKEMDLERQMNLAKDNTNVEAIMKEMAAFSKVQVAVFAMKVTIERDKHHSERMQILEQLKDENAQDRDELRQRELGLALRGCELELLTVCISQEMLVRMSSKAKDKLMKAEVAELNKDRLSDEADQAKSPKDLGTSAALKLASIATDPNNKLN